MLLEFHLIDFAVMSAEHDVSAKPLSRKVPTKRHAVSYKLSRWDASDFHLISLTLLHVHSSRRALAHSILLHFPSLPPYYNILVFLFISILSFLINLSAFLLYNLRPRHSPVSMNSLPGCCSFAGRFLDTAKQDLAFLPATIDCGKAKVTILESDLEKYPGMWLKANSSEQDKEKGILRAAFAPYPKEMAYYPWRHMSHVKSTCDYIATSTGKRNYPWRIFAITEHDTQMPTNNLVYALATPNKIGDTSWIKPGKVAWDWWNDWNLKGVDFKAGINFDTYKYYIDFAHNHGLEYIVLDEGWYNSKEGSILKPIDDIQLPKLIEYGKSKNVDIVLWAVFNVMDENLETICKTYADMGIKGFKVDFMDRDDQTAIEMMERLAACTAKHHLILDLHGIYKPHGLNRTYPNILNYESVFGMEECRWTEAKNDMPLYDVTFPYIRMMAGQVDFTPGAMRNGTRDNWKAIYTKPISMGTRCHQAACYIVQDSPFTMLADTPTNYEADEPYTRYIASLPVIFDKTIVPQGEIGKYIVTARKKGNDWYVGGQSNWDERTLTLKFDFLAAGDYEAIVLKDGINANHDAEDYKIEKYDIHQNSEMKIHLASGGGFVIKLIKK